LLESISLLSDRFTLMVHHRFQAHSCCDFLSMNISNETDVSRQTENRKKQIVKKSRFYISLSVKYSLFTMFYWCLYGDALRYSGRYSEKLCVSRSERLFLETVPTRYYLLAVFQKKHRRHHLRKFVALHWNTLIMPLAHKNLWVVRPMR